ncbi:DUF4838 domain-containing protein [Microlunatus sp. Y2014]|uniref:DUF4838 domain-containing protein n=1 Tax=Microlunatus sp. Y2014 TaxID=3418488 RepID=UPI003DA788D2
MSALVSRRTVLAGGVLTAAATALPALRADASGTSRDLVRDGRARGLIVISADAADLETRAAEELQEHVRLVSGADVPVLRGDPTRLAVEASLMPGRLVAPRPGHHEIRAVVTNPSTRAVRVTVSVPAEPDGLHVEFRMPSRPLILAARSSVAISGRVTVLQHADPEVHEISVTVTAEPGQTSTLPLVVDHSLANLLSNPGIEDATFLPWYRTTHFTPDTTVAHSGTTSIRFSGWDGATSGYERGLKFTGGRAYRLTFWGRRDAGSTSDVRLRLSELDAQSQRIRLAFEATVPLGSDWQRHAVTFYANPALDERYVQTWFNLVLAGAGTIWLDDFALQEVGSIEGYDPGASPDGPGNGVIVPTPVGPAPELAAPVRTRVDGAVVCLGTPDAQPAVAAPFADELEQVAGSDGFIVGSRDQVVYVLGTRPRGVLNGVYDLIERELGVIWTRAGESGTIYEPKSTITLVGTDRVEVPALAMRGWHLTGVGAGGEFHADPATELMMARNRLNAKFAEVGTRTQWPRQQSIGIEPVNLGHNLHEWLLQSVSYQGWDPERQAGCWNTDENGNPQVELPVSQLNFWNADVAVAVSESVVAFLDTYGLAHVGVGIEDNSSVLQVPESLEPFSYAPGQSVDPDHPAYLSTVYYTFLNSVARAVAAEHPEATVTTFAYVFTEIPPLCEVEPNVAVVVAPIHEDMRRPLTDPDSAVNTAVRENLVRWSQKTSNVVLYNYYGCFPNAASDFERPIAPRIRADVKLYEDLGFTGTLPEGVVDVETSTRMWSISTLTMWLYPKLAWNPEADIDALTERFCTISYGAAAPDMIEYHRLLTQAWDGNDRVTLPWNAPLTVYLLAFYADSDRNDLMQAALDRAWGLADPDQRERIRPIKEAFERNVDKVVYEPTEKPVALQTSAGRDQVLATTDMTDPIWSGAPVLSDFRNPGTIEPVPGLATKVRMLWDATHLYVAYECFDDGIGDLAAPPLNSSGSWWNGNSDYVETYVGSEDPWVDAAAEYRVWFTNPTGAGIVFGSNKEFQASPGPWVTSTAVVDEAGTEQDHWVAIQAIPMSLLGVSGSATTATTLYGYFNREHHTGSSFLSQGWGAASVWSTSSFRPIELRA